MSSNNTKTNNQTTNQLSSETLNKVKDDLSVKYNTYAVNVVNNVRQQQNIPQDKKEETITDSIMSGMQKGASEFEKKIGLPMTYSEMRELWG
jgi:hypothetical protein